MQLRVGVLGCRVESLELRVSRRDLMRDWLRNEERLDERSRERPQEASDGIRGARGV